MIMVTFTKLFVISIVASSRSVSSNKFLIFSSEGCFPSSIEFKSDGESENSEWEEVEPLCYSHLNKVDILLSCYRNFIL